MEDTGAPFVISSMILRIMGMVFGIVVKPLLAVRCHRCDSTPGQRDPRIASCFFVIALASRTDAISCPLPAVPLVAQPYIILLNNIKHLDINLTDTRNMIAAITAYRVSTG